VDHEGRRGVLVQQLDPTPPFCIKAKGDKNFVDLFQFYPVAGMKKI
jgi:hypothetical protein